MIATLSHWWSTHSPFALNERLHGPMKPRDKAVFILTAWLGLFVFFAVVWSACVMGAGDG